MVLRGSLYAGNLLSPEFDRGKVRIGWQLRYPRKLFARDEKRSLFGISNKESGWGQEEQKIWAIRKQIRIALSFWASVW